MASQRHPAIVVAAALALSASGALAPKAFGVTFGPATTVGLMQQPTSHYYHEVYGGEVRVGADDSSLLGRVSYIERPEFSAEGFADKDYGYFALIGTRVTKTTGHGIDAFIGVGKMQGYVRAEDDRYSASRRSYALPGLVANIQYGARFHGIELDIAHQQFVGYVDKTQLQSYVAWPFSFYLVNFGVAL